MLGVILICIICILWSWSRRNRKNDEPPLCSGGLWFLGHALEFTGNSVKLWKTIQRVNKETLERGGVLRTTIGPRTIYAVTNPDECLLVANTCLQKEAIYEFAKPWVGDGLVTSGASQWKIQRKLLNPAFSQHVLDNFMEVFNEKSRSLVKSLSIEVGKGPFDHWDYLKTSTFETVCLTTLGVDFKEKNLPNNDFVQAIAKIMNLIITRFQSFWLHNNFLFSLSSLKRKQDKCIKILHQISNSILREKKKSFLNRLANEKSVENKEKGSKFKPFMELLLELAHETKVFTDREIREHVDTMVGAARDTFSANIMYCVLLIASYPRVQEKIYEELKNIFGDEDRDVTKLDLPKLVYLEAVIKESLRVYTSAPLIGRLLDRDVKLRNCTLYKGNSVFLLICGINRHPMWGPDVDEFKPERWLDPSTLPDSPLTLPSFGIGRRNCIGKAYSIMSMKVNLVHICRNYLLHGDNTKLKLKLDIILKPVSGHHISIENRK